MLDKNTTPTKNYTEVVASSYDTRQETQGGLISPTPRLTLNCCLSVLASHSVFIQRTTAHIHKQSTSPLLIRTRQKTVSS